ncbi:glycosyltransferase [Pedobacter psychrodurus]|uniref:glycosyltransferase family protein n=1 Tax=Pedobacter psychrodurus TaxID=2530456 RepID=UPI002930FF67|nr:glycosyltransferase [Pedobacter psychrodurus]
MELRDKVIVILGATRFDWKFESTSYHTAKYLAEGNEVYYVDFPYTLKDYFKKNEGSEIALRLPHFKKGANGILDSGFPRLKILILPLLLSINFLPEGRIYRRLLLWNERRISDRINRIMAERGISDFIFINSFNFHYPGVSAMLPRAALKVYHCVDPIITDYDQRHGFLSEDLLINNSDLVICTSKALYREKMKKKTHTFFIPNAADLTVSSRALDPGLLPHPFVSDIPRPVIGYLGAIERRIDFDMLIQVAIGNPDKSFVLVGPTAKEFVPSEFEDLNNVYFRESVPYDQMPAVVKGFDIAMVPFKKDEVSATIFPLKLFEYLGTGRPVISTDFNMDLLEFTFDSVRYCHNAGDFSDAISFYLKNDSQEAKANRLSIAADNTWSRRLSEMSSLISGFYHEKTGQN